MTKRPNHGNAHDACCSCGVVLTTPEDHEKPKANDLHVWQPNDSDPPQWICPKCKGQLVADLRRFA